MLTKTFGYNFLAGQREILQRILWANMILHDRKDIHSLEIDSIREDHNKMEISVDYKCIEINVNPDYDW